MNRTDGEGRAQIRAAGIAPARRPAPGLRRSGRSRWGAFSAALLVEALAIAVLLGAFAPSVRKVSVAEIHASIIDATKPPTPVAPPPQPQPLSPAHDLAVIAPRVRYPLPTPAPITLPRVAASASPDPLAVLETQVRQALQLEVSSQYSDKARRQGQQGQVEVEFEYLNGSIRHAKVLQSSGLPLLDAAALATVRDAHYPAPPAAVQHVQVEFVLPISFRLVTPPCAPAGSPRRNAVCRGRQPAPAGPGPLAGP